MTELFSAKQNVDGSLTLSGGQTVLNFHNADACAGDVCPVHKPSDHKYRDLPLFFNGKNMLRELEDGSIVPDPDDYLLAKGNSVITQNSAKCLDCGDEIFSEHRHDFKWCSCGNVSVDGGAEYVRHGFRVFEKYENTSTIFVWGDLNQA